MRKVSSLLSLLGAAGLALSAAPALANDGDHGLDRDGGHACDDGKTCRGKGHDDHGQGHGYGHDHGGGADPAPFEIERPGSDRGAFILQIGVENQAAIVQ